MPNNAGNGGYIVASFGYSGDVCRKFSGTSCCALKLSGTVEHKTTNKGVGHCDFFLSSQSSTCASGWLQSCLPICQLGHRCWGKKQEIFMKSTCLQVSPCCLLEKSLWGRSLRLSPTKLMFIPKSASFCWNLNHPSHASCLWQPGLLIWTYSGNQGGVRRDSNWNGIWMEYC